MNQTFKLFIQCDVTQEGSFQGDGVNDISVPSTFPFSSVTEAMQNPTLMLGCNTKSLWNKGPQSLERAGLKTTNFLRHFYSFVPQAPDTQSLTSFWQEGGCCLGEWSLKLSLPICRSLALHIIPILCTSGLFKLSVFVRGELWLIGGNRRFK